MAFKKRAKPLNPERKFCGESERDCELREVKTLSNNQETGKMLLYKCVHCGRLVTRNW